MSDDKGFSMYPFSFAFFSYLMKETAGKSEQKMTYWRVVPVHSLLIYQLSALEEAESDSPTFPENPGTHSF